MVFLKNIFNHKFDILFSDGKSRWNLQSKTWYLVLWWILPQLFACINSLWKFSMVIYDNQSFSYSNQSFTCSDQNPACSNLTSAYSDQLLLYSSPCNSNIRIRSLSSFPGNRSLQSISSENRNSSTVIRQEIYSSDG